MSGAPHIKQASSHNASKGPWPHDVEIWVMKNGLKIQLLSKKRYEHQRSAAEKANRWNARHVPVDLKGLYEQAFITPLSPKP